VSTGKRIAVASIVCLVLYPPLKLYWAERQVTAFCNEVAMGTSVDELERKANDSWLKIRKISAMTIEGRSSPAKLLVWEGFAFGRWFCEISHVNGKAGSTRIVELD
jgi:hypothetical protein